MKKYVFLLVFLMIGVTTFWLINKNQPKKSTNIEQIQKLTINNKPINISKNTIINFWAPWCSPCIKEIPMINQFYQDNKHKVDLIGIGIDSKENIDKFSQKLKLEYPNTIAGIEGLELSKQMGNSVGVLPYTILIDSKGNILKKHIGEITKEQLLEWKNIL